MQNGKNIFADKIFGEIFDTFICGNTEILQTSFSALRAVEVCNVIASALVILQDGNVELNEVVKYDLPGKILGLKKQLEKSKNPDKDVIFLLDIIRSAPTAYFYDVFEFIKNKIKAKN